MVTKSNLKEGLYYLLVLIISTRFVKHIVGHISITQYDQNYLVEGTDWILRILYGSFILILYCAIFSSIKKYIFKNNKDYLTYHQIAWMISSVIPIIYISDLISRVLRNTQNDVSLLSSLSPLIAEAICGICGLFILIGNESMLALHVKEGEMLKMEMILKSKLQHYVLKKEAVDQINQKYHDLKNHLIYLNKITDRNKFQKYLRSLQDEIKVYETIHQTGNETLDIILSDKYIKCQDKKIQLILFVEGRELMFMSPVDIATVFGNALDNAIESVEKIQIPEKREIIVKFSKDKNWLLIHFENYYCHRLKWNSENLETTKKNKEKHGFGLKSIQYVVNKYNGNMTTRIKDDQFILNILFSCEE